MSILVGRKAPDFTTQAVLGNGEIVGEFNLSSSLNGKYGVVFFYPLDFTFVCPSEIIAMDHRAAKLRELGCEIVGISIDSHFTHNAWRNTPVNEGGIGLASAAALKLGEENNQLIDENTRLKKENEMLRLSLGAGEPSDGNVQRLGAKPQTVL